MRTWLVSGRSCSNPFWIPVTALLYAHVHKDGNDTCAWPGWHVLIPLVSFLYLNRSSWEQSSLHLNSTLAPLFLSVCVLQLSRTDLGFAHCSGVFTSFEFGADPEVGTEGKEKEWGSSLGKSGGREMGNQWFKSAGFCGSFPHTFQHTNKHVCTQTARPVQTHTVLLCTSHENTRLWS